MESRMKGYQLQRRYNGPGSAKLFGESWDPVADVAISKIDAGLAAQVRGKGVVEGEDVFLVPGYRIVEVDLIEA